MHPIADCSDVLKQHLEISIVGVALDKNTRLNDIHNQNMLERRTSLGVINHKGINKEVY